MYLDSYNFAQLAVLGALTISAVSAVALASIWIVAGRRFRWPLRASLLVVLLGPLLLAPAFDLWSSFAIQAVSMIVALAAVRGIHAGWTVGRSAWSFRLTDALALTLYVGLIAAPISAHRDRLPEFGYVTRFGLGFALLGLMGAWLATSPWKWWGYVARAVVWLGLPLLTVDLIDFGDENMFQYYGYRYYRRESALLTWVTPPLVVVAARGCGLLGVGSHSAPRAKWRSACRQGAGALTTAVIVLGVVVGYCAILDDPGDPQKPMPSPNGYDELNRILSGFNVELPADSAFQATDTQLAAFLGRTAEIRSASARAVELPSVARLDDTSLEITRIQERRNLARAWEAEMVAASRRGDVAAMVPPAESLLLLSKATWNGGIVVDMLVASGFDNMATQMMRSRTSWPDDPRWQPLLPTLLECDSGLDSVKIIQDRDARWERHVIWPFRLNHLLGRFGSLPAKNYVAWGNRARADVRLLTLELALARYRALHGDNPESLEQLVPEVLPAVPRDPFAEDRPLAYERQAQGYVLYSVGADGVDNAGNYNGDASLRGDPGYDYRLP